VSRTFFPPFIYEMLAAMLDNSAYCAWPARPTWTEHEPGCLGPWSVAVSSL